MSRKKPTPPQVAVAIEPVTVHVEIAVGGHQVIIEAADPLDVVAAKALHLWQAVDKPGSNTGDTTSSVGFAISERAESPLMPPEADLPYRLVC